MDFEEMLLIQRIEVAKKDARNARAANKRAIKKFDDVVTGSGMSNEAAQLFWGKVIDTGNRLIGAQQRATGYKEALEELRKEQQ